MSVKNIITTIILALYAAGSSAGDNKVYIDQAGDNSTITITQDGGGNTVKGIGAAQDQKALIEGNDTIVSITQTGSGNSLTFGIKAGATGSHNSFTYNITGSNATATVNCNQAGGGDCSNNTISLTQGSSTVAADNSTALITLNGTDNTLTVGQAGGNNQKATATITGTNTSSTVNMTGGAGNEFTLNVGQTVNATDKATSNITTTGAGNKVTSSLYSRSNWRWQQHL
jgi:hypothetical protein